MSHNFMKRTVSRISWVKAVQSWRKPHKTSSSTSKMIHNVSLSLHVSMTRGVHSGFLLRWVKRGEKSAYGIHINLCLCQVAHPPKQLLQRKIISYSNHNCCQKCLFIKSKGIVPYALIFVRDPVTVFSHLTAALQQDSSSSCQSSQIAAHSG